MGISTPRAIVRYEGLFDFDGVYNAMTSWFKMYGYIWQEETYKHKVKFKGAEQQWIWTGEKEITDYIKYNIRIEGHSWDITEIEVEKDGRKKTLMNGRMQLIIEPTLNLDWQNRWGQNKFSRWLGGLYEKYVLVKEIESVYFDQLSYRVWNLQAVLKKYFDMQTKWHSYAKYLGEN